MGYLEGLLAGFNERHNQYRAEQMQQEHERNQRETAVFNTLLSSSDPDVQALAATGMITGAMGPQRAGGLRGWIGDMTTNPIMAQLRHMIDTSTTTTPAALPSRNITGVVPSEPGTAGEVTTQTTRAGQPGPEPTHADTAIPYQPISPRVAQPPPTGPAPITGLTMGPLSSPQPTVTRRSIFPTPEDLAAQRYRGEERGRIEGDVAGMRAAGISDAEARAAILARERGRYGVGTVQSIQGETPDGQRHFAIFDKQPGSPTWGQYLDPVTKQPIPNFRPLTATASMSLGADAERVAIELFGTRASALVGHPEQMALVNAVVQQRKGQLLWKDALGFANRMLPNVDLQQQMDLAQALIEGTAAPYAAMIGGGTAAPGAPPGAPPPAVGQPPPVGPGEPVAPPTPPATPSSRVGQPPQAATHPGIQLPSSMGTATKETGKPVAPAIQQALARTQAMNDTIDKALASLEPYKADTRLQTTLDLVKKYRFGTEGDPAAISEAQLSDLAGLQQAASATLGGTSRSQRIYADKRQHTPRLPSGRQAMVANAGLGATATQGASLLIKGDEGGWDSPAQMYQKLKNLREVNERFMHDMQTAAGTTAAPKAPAPPTTGGTAPATPQVKKIGNEWVIIR
jgi:hypothetical protein